MFVGPCVRIVNRNSHVPGRRTRHRHRCRYRAVDPVAGLALVEALVPGLVGLDGDVLEVPAQHRVPAMAKLPPENGALQFLHRRRHGDPALSELDDGQAILREVCHHVAPHVRVEGDFPDFEPGAGFADAILDGVIIDHVARRRCDESVFGPGRVRHLVAVRLALEVVGRTEEPGIDHILAAYPETRYNDGQVVDRRQVDAQPARFVFEVDEIDLGEDGIVVGGEATVHEDSPSLLAEGIDLPDPIWEELGEVAVELGVEVPTI